MKFLFGTIDLCNLVPCVHINESHLLLNDFCNNGSWNFDHLAVDQEYFVLITVNQILSSVLLLILELIGFQVVTIGS